MFPTINKKETGVNLRRIMDMRGVKPKDIQEYLGFGCVQSVYRWLDGVSMPTVDNLYAISKMLQVPSILIKMAQLNRRKTVLDVMRKRLPKSREEQRSYMSRNSVPEYRYINYDLELVKNEYELVSKSIMEMQMALDKYNQTVQFEVDI